MNTISRFLMTAVVAAAVLSLHSVFADEPATARPTVESLDGNWLGTIKTGAKEYRMLIKLATPSNNGLNASLTSLDTDGLETAAERAEFEAGLLRVVLKDGNFFEGKLDAERREFVGSWNQGKRSWPLTLKWVEKPPELRRPQEPKKPYPYEEREVNFENAKAGVMLAGSLTLPKTTGPHPAVLLVSGSGPQDRNETVFAHRPFWVLADHLTRRGVAVLRVDDRGVGSSTGQFSGSTTEDFVDDVLAGVAFLKGRNEINPKQIGLIGHSEGGVIAPLAAVRSSDISFIVLLAAPGLTGEELCYLQGEATLKAAGMPEAVIAWNRSLQERLFAVLKAEKDEAAAKAKMREVVREELAKLGAISPTVHTDLDRTIEKVSRPWFRHFLTLDPQTALRQVKCPVLAVFGEHDVQVPPEENAHAIESGLEAGKHGDFTVETFPTLNHLLQTCESGAVSEYGKIEETMSPAVLEAVAEWIGKRVAAR